MMKFTANRSSSVPIANQWKCSRCGLSVEKESVLTGGSRLVKGVLTCSECWKKQRRRVALQAAVYLYPVGAFVLAGMLSCILLCIHEIRSDQSDQAAMGFEKERARILELLHHDRYLDAIHAVDALETRAARSKSRYLPEVEDVLIDVRARVDNWCDKNFGTSDPEQRRVVTTLFRAFPEATSSGKRRLVTVAFHERSLCATALVLTDDSSLSDHRDTLWRQARQWLLFMAEHFAQFEFSGVRMIEENGANEISAGDTYQIERAQIPQLQEASTPEEIEQLLTHPPGSRLDGERETQAR